MSQSYSRPLNNDRVVDQFLYEQLGYQGAQDIIPLIVKGEIGLPQYKDASTLDNKDYREKGVRENSKRWQLRSQIVQELITLKREADDDKIKLGAGGALPNNLLKNENQAVIVIGLPASGKSSVSNKISEEFGAIILDSDFAKRKFPEFYNYEFGASLVHEESDAIVFACNQSNKPNDFETLFEKSVKNRTNIVIPKIGHNAKSIKTFAELLKNHFQYDVHLILINLDRKDATLRAVERYRSSKRYVPLGLIFDGYSNDPILTYYILKCKEKSLFSSFGEISTHVKPSVCTDLENNSPAALFNVQ